MVPASVTVVVAYGHAPGQVDLRELTLPQGGTLRDAVRDCGMAQDHGLDLDTLDAGVWGRRLEADTPLRDGDRVELYRGLRVDPKEARRQRYKGR